MGNLKVWTSVYIIGIILLNTILMTINTYEPRLMFLIATITGVYSCYHFANWVDKK